MGYFLTSEGENAPPLTVLARPKTHTPGARVSNLGQRFYSPNLGRWISRDPIGEEGGINHYIIVANDPLAHVDPLGMDSFNFPGGSVWFKPSWDIWPQWHTGATVADTLTATMTVVPDASYCRSCCNFALEKDAVDMTGKWWAYLWSWGASGHEQMHKARFRVYAYEGLRVYARSKEGCYKTSAGASCWKAVVENQAEVYYMAFGWLKSHELDSTEASYASRHAVFQAASDAASVALTAAAATCPSPCED